MSDIRIICKRPDGGCSIITPSDNALKKMTIEEIAAKNIKSDWQWRIASTADLPKNPSGEVDRGFRNAWCDVTPESRVDIDCEKARDIELVRFRAKRNALLEQTDKDYVMAMSMGDTALQSSIAEKKAALRDSTEPLKTLNVAGKINDETILSQITAEGVKDPLAYTPTSTKGGGNK